MSSTDIVILQRNALPKMTKLSSLELMLDRIQQRDEDRRPKDDELPALPSRPVSKARQPPGRRRSVLLPFHFQEVESNGGGEIKLIKTKRTEAGSVGNGCFLLNKIGRVNDAEERVLLGVVEIQKCFRGHQARCHYHELKRAIISLQSFVRGENARKNYQVSKKRPTRDHVQVPHSEVAELQRRVLRAEAELGNKNEENAALQLRLEQFDRKWQQYEAKMKSMEKMWQDQLASIQERLAAENGRRACENPDLPLNGVPRQVNGRVCTIKHLIEQHERGMTDDDSNSDNGLGSTQLDSSTNPEKELRKLKTRFKAWNKDYKTRLRETKATLNKPENSRAKKVSKRWWER